MVALLIEALGMILFSIGGILIVLLPFLIIAAIVYFVNFLDEKWEEIRENSDYWG